MQKQTGEVSESYVSSKGQRTPDFWNNGKQGDLTFEAVEAIQNLNSWLPGRSLELKDGIN